MTPKRHVIPVFVPHLGCPNNCVFCNQRRISGALTPATPETVRRAVCDASFLTDDGIQKQLAFYGGSFTAIPVREQEALLLAAREFLSRFPGAGLRVSTRPDCVDEETLCRLKHAGVTTVELGAQSMDESVLQASGRGHTASDTVRAARLIREAGLELVLQMMTGLPGDTPEKSAETAEKLIALNPDGVRIYPTVIIRDTALWNMWRRGEYREHTVEDAVRLCAGLVPMFEEAEIPIIRLGLNPSDELSGIGGTGGDGAVAGAYHPAFGELVYSRIFLNRARKLLGGQGRIRSVTLGVAQNRVSIMTGQHKCNIRALMEEFELDELRIAPADTGRKDAGREIVIMCIEKRPPHGI